MNIFKNNIGIKAHIFPPKKIFFLQYILPLGFFETMDLLNKNHKNLVVPHIVPRGTANPWLFMKFQKKGKIDPPYCTSTLRRGHQCCSSTTIKQCATSGLKLAAFRFREKYLNLLSCRGVLFLVNLGTIICYIFIHIFLFFFVSCHTIWKEMDYHCI